MLEAAGGENVFADVKRESVQVTTEMILARAPDVIVELRYGEGVAAANLEAERASWSALSAVPAVRRGRIVLLVGDEFVVPGPRIVAATERLAAALHP
jgi:iron complex transport system substrate-binding protein